MRFSLPVDCELRPFVIATPASYRSYEEHSQELRFYDVYDPKNRPFVKAMNRANCYAHDGESLPAHRTNALGMPRWVMLDCAILPAGMFGFEAPAEALPADIRERLDPDGELEWIGVSEYSAIPMQHDEQTVIGISLFSLVTGIRLGLRSKALGLLMIQPKSMMGVTQFDSPGLKVHEYFGDMQIVSSQVAIHAKPDKSFVYSLPVPEPSVLEKMIAGEATPCEVQRVEAARQMTLNPTDPQAVSACVRDIAESPHTWYITGVGDISDNRITSLIFGSPHE